MFITTLVSSILNLYFQAEIYKQFEIVRKRASHMKATECTCLVIICVFILQLNPQTIQANPIAVFIVQHLLSKASDYIWDKATGKPDVVELDRRLKKLEETVYRTAPNLVPPIRDLRNNITPDTSKEDFQRMVQKADRQIIELERRADITDKEIAILKKRIARLESVGNKGITVRPPTPQKPPPVATERTQRMRIMVVISETHLGRRIPEPAGETEIIRQFLQAGFRIVDQEQTRHIRDSEQVRQALAGDIEAAQSLGQRYGVELLIVGAAMSEKALSGGLLGELISARARLEARAVRTDTGDILVADGQVASGVDITEYIAGKKALAEAGKKWVEANLPLLRQRLGGE